MRLSRRDAILGGLFGAGSLGLRALASGLPASFIANPRLAWADVPACTSPQFLIFATSAYGDPLNCNVPGSYAYPQVYHAADPVMAATTFSLAGNSVVGAELWATGLPQNVLDRTCFFHHATSTNNHADEPKVLELMGASTTMAVSSYAEALAPCLGTIQAQPVILGAQTSGELLSFQGHFIADMPPSSLQYVLGVPTGPLGDLQKVRDDTLNQINALVKQSRNPAEQAFLDQWALSQQQVRALSQDLLQGFSSITDDSLDSQIAAAVLLIRLNLAPVLTIHVPFGGDNHVDFTAGVLLATEVSEAKSSMASLAKLFTQLDAAGLTDKVTFAWMNVFGRTLALSGNGRTHNANHHASVIIGKNVRGGVVGGLDPNNGLRAQTINSATGAADPSGDIPFANTLAAAGSTLGAALGLPAATIASVVPTGTIVHGALA